MIRQKLIRRMMIHHERKIHRKKMNRHLRSNRLTIYHWMLIHPTIYRSMLTIRRSTRRQTNPLQMRGWPMPYSKRRSVLKLTFCAS
jgi:hypothetical protein